MSFCNGRLLDALYSSHIKPLQLISGAEMLKRMEVSREMAGRLGIPEEDAEILERYGIGEELIPRDSGVRAALVQLLRNQDGKGPAIWQVVSGMYEGYEEAPNRRERIRALWKATVLLIRRELKWNEQEKELKIKNAKCKMEGGRLESCAGERSAFWDPTNEVCRRNGISQSKLSGFFRELTGSNLVQTIDNVKAESLRGKLRKEIREFVVQLKMRNEKCKMDGTGQLKIKNVKCKMNALTPRAQTAAPVGPLPEGEGLGAHGAINVTENGEPSPYPLQGERGKRGSISGRCGRL